MANDSTIPDEIITDILTRLPVKSLLRFSCVCKPWWFLIKDSDFIKKHLKQSIENNNHFSLILRTCNLYSVDFDACDKAVELDHPLKTPELGTEIVGSCNGLLCLYNNEDDLVLWNPSTRQYEKLPVSSIEFPPGFSICRTTLYGFGYDPITDDYMVVRIIQFYEKDDGYFDSEVKVYSLSRNSWKRIQDIPYYMSYRRAHGILASNAIHWVVNRTPDSDVSKLIVSFDLRDEEYREVPQPEILGDKKFHMNAGVLGGSLCMLCNHHHVRMDIWMMKDYGVNESWTKLFSIAQPKVVRSFEYLSPIAFSKNGCVLLEQDNKKLLWYDPRNRKVKYLKIRGLPSSFEAEICVGSLVPPNDGVDG